MEQEYLSTVHDAIRGMTDALQDVQRDITDAMGCAQWDLPIWHDLEKQARRLATQTQRLAVAIHDARARAMS